MTNHSSTAIQLQEHPISLLNVVVNQQTFVRTDTYQNEDIDGKDIEIGIRLLSESSPDSRFKIGMRAVYGLPDEKFDLQDPTTLPPITIIAEITGEFLITRDLSPEVIQRYQNNGAYFVLFPYIREQIYGISMRGGIKPIIIPAIMVPVIKITPDGKLVPKETSKESTV